jgi:hydroxymethylglutaryl-CoA lyase
MLDKIIITECPRDAMQGITQFIPTDQKVKYMNSLLKVGFDVLDFGSFVNPKVMPQMADTDEVAERLDLTNTNTKLLAIIGNQKGAERAEAYKQISILGFPFSVSPTFLKRNINSDMAETVTRIGEIKEIADRSGKDLVIYISMAFGNPYNDPWNTDVVGEWVEKLAWIGIRKIALSDTIGEANPENIDYLFSYVIPNFPEVEFGAHFHTTPSNWKANIDAAFNAGCRKFDAALKGFGGCPMAKDSLTGNLPTENLVSLFSEKNIPISIDPEAFAYSMSLTTETFPLEHA